MLYSSFYFIAIVIRFTIVVIYYLHQQMRELSEIYRTTLIEPRGENVEKMIKLRQSVFEGSRYLPTTLQMKYKYLN